MSTLPLSARPDFAVRVSALIDEQREAAFYRRQFPARSAMSPADFDVAQKRAAAQVFSVTYPIDYNKGEQLFKASVKDVSARKGLAQWKRDGQDLVARSLKVCGETGMRPVRGLVSRLFKRRRRLTATQWYAVTGGSR